MSRIDSPIMVPIVHIVDETPHVRTFTFRYELGSEPGQFVMLWIPGYDQKPFSIGNDTGDTFSLTIYGLGASTKHLWTFKKGDRLGVTGPYGTNYSFEPQQHLITVGGGYGAAPLGYLGERAIAQGCSVDFVVGAQTKQDLLFEQRMNKCGAAVSVSTDDGSKGVKGYNTLILQSLLEERKKRGTLKSLTVYACGPELMQRSVAQIAQQFGVESQVSVERYMKCGFGVCGNCCVDDTGMTTCVDGPVITGVQALRLSEFGAYHRDKTGVRHQF